MEYFRVLKSLITLKAINIGSETSILKHQNRMLFSKLLLLRDKLRKATRKLSSVDKRSEELLQFESVLLRFWDILMQHISSKKGSVVPVSKRLKRDTTNRVEASLYDLLFIMDQSDLTTADALKFDQETATFSAVEERLKTLFNKLSKCLKNYDPAQVNVVELMEVTEANMSLSVFKQRSILLQNELEKTKDKLSAAEDAFEKAVSRLNQYKSLEFLPDAEKPVISDSNALEQEPKVEKQDVKSEEANGDMAELAAKRLKELRKLNEANVELAAQLEKLQSVSLHSKAVSEVYDNFEARVKASSVFTSLEGEYRLLEAEVKGNRESQLKLRHERDDARKELQEYKSSLEKLQTNLLKKVKPAEAGVEDKLQDVKAELSDLKKRHRKLKYKFSAEQSRVKKEQGLVKNYKASEKRLNETVHMLTKQLKALQKEKLTETELQQQNSELLEEVTGLSKALERESALVKKVRKENRNLAETLRSKQEKENQRMDSKVEEIQNLQKQMTKLKAELAEAEACRAPLEDEVSLLKRGNAESLALLEDQKAMIEQLEKRKSAAELDLSIKDSALQAKLLLLKEAEEEKRLLQERNEELQKQLASNDFDRNRADEKIAKQKRVIADMSNASIPEGNAGLKLQAMEAALRCPVNTQKWKTALLKRCSHAFAKSTLLKTLNSRNRKCPTCKSPFARDDILPIYLYQGNSDDEE